MIAIVIPTYFRPDGRTAFYLERALSSIKSQTYQDYEIFLIGDNYTNHLELFRIAAKYGIRHCVNLPVSVERSKYPFGDYRLFCAGGVTPGLKGIDMALDNGFKYVCHLDHDDYWESNHLQLISEVLDNDPLFVCTLSTYFGAYLPFIEPTNEIMEYASRPGCCSLSASCIKYSDTDIRFRDHFAETGEAFPADADFWQRLEGKGYLITTVTVHHDEEGYSFRGDFQ